MNCIEAQYHKERKMMYSVINPSYKNSMNNQEVFELLCKIDRGHLLTLAEEIEIPNIRSIYWTEIEIIPKSIRVLKNLEVLELYDSKVNMLSEGIGKLRHLRTLALNYSQLSALPESIGNLTCLESLDLSYTRISMLPDGIKDLINLKKLSLQGTQISMLPDSIENLTNLEFLNLSGTQIRLLPKTIGDLPKLKCLILEGLSLTELPLSLLHLNLEYKNTKYRRGAGEQGIFIHGLELQNQPIEIFSQNRELIFNYYETTRIKKTLPINECKVVFLGDGGAGKSLIIHRLLNDGEISPDYKGESTPGICISSKKYLIGKDEIELHFWDFGGQEIMHSMHRLFLTTRTLYIIVTNARYKKANEQAWYWIRNIKSFASGAPVLLLVNQKDQNPSVDVNEQGLRDDYPGLKHVRIVSALKDTKEEFDTDIRDLICQTVYDMETVHTPFSASWLSLMNDIQEMKKDYITSDDFYKMCSKNRIHTNKKLLDQIVSWYQDLGVCFYSKAHPISAQYMVLKPRWLLNALYILIYNGRKYAINGIIPETAIYTLICEKVSDDVIKKVWGDITYKPEEIQYIINVLLNYELIFRLDNKRFFVPMLCNENEPEMLDDFDSEDVFHVSFEYDYLPENALHRLMIRHGYELNMNTVWRTGAMFERKQCGWTSLVRVKDNRLDIYAKTDNQKIHPINSYLDIMRESIYIINNEFGLVGKEFIAYRKNDLEDRFEYEVLEGSKNAGLLTVYSGVFKRIISIDEILGILNRMDILPNDDIDRKIAVLLNSLVDALHKLQGNSTYYTASENQCNSYIRDLLGMRGYACKDQTFHGVSATGKSDGELDMLISDKANCVDLSIFEALRLNAFGTRDKKYLMEHLIRLLDNYNPKGFSNLFLVSYVSWSKNEFNELFNNYSKYVMRDAGSEFKFTKSAIIESFNSSFCRCLVTGYDCGSIVVNVYHIVVRIAK